MRAHHSSTTADGQALDPAYVAKEQVRLIFMQAPISNSVVLFITVLYYIILQPRLNSYLVSAWAILMIATACYRMYLWLHRHKNPQAISAESWFRRYQIGSAIVGIAWSLIYPFILVTNDPFVFNALLMLAFGVISSAVAILAASLPTFMLYSYPQGLTLIVTLLFFGDVGYYWLSLAVSLYLLMTTLFARNANRSIMRSIALQAHNTFLIEDLNGEIAKREEIIAKHTLELKKTNSDLAATLKAIPDLLFELDENGRYLEIWARAPELLASQPQAMLGKTVTEILPSEAAVQVQAAIAEASKDGFSHGQVLQIPLTQGEHWFELSTAMKPLPDGKMHFIMLSRDITEQRLISAEIEEHRRHLENMVLQRTCELVEARDQAERLSRVKGEFLANMSHEIRTPMNGVLGMTELLSRDNLSETQRQYVATIQRSGSVLLRVIDDVLDFSRIETGRLEIDSQVFDLQEVLRDIEQLFAASAQSKGLELIIELQHGLHWVRLGDAKRMTQILFNLVGNALKFTDQGTVRVAVEQGEATTDAVVIEVSDTGIGIPFGTQKHLFHAFQQADSSTSRKYGGSGLGLAISRRLAQLMNGDIELESSPGKGSTFRVKLQLPRAAAADDSGTLDRLVSEAAPRQNHQARVLVAEDNPVNQLVTQEMLASLGCSVQVADNGEQALSAYRDSFYDLVLMDLHMPRMDGIEATRRIRQLERDRDQKQRTPIIALTADVLPEQRATCERNGMDGFVGKPFNLKQLKVALAQWLETSNTPAKP